VIGDVGLRSKLDYTAHGDAVNAAARLEAANKQFAPSISVGPAAAARRDAGMFRPLGTIVVRGRDELMAVFEPWPSDALERRDDMVVRRMAEELNAATDHAA
jgi:adenylate cyclase